MQPTETPPDGHADVRIVAASLEASRRVAEVLRQCCAATEQRSYPADSEGGTRLQLTVDTTPRQNRHGPGWRRAAPRRTTADGSEPTSRSGPFGLFGE